MSAPHEPRSGNPPRTVTTGSSPGHDAQGRSRSVARLGCLCRARGAVRLAWDAGGVRRTDAVHAAILLENGCCLAARVSPAGVGRARSKCSAVTLRPRPNRPNGGAHGSSSDVADRVSHARPEHEPAAVTTAQDKAGSDGRSRSPCSPRNTRRRGLHRRPRALAGQESAQSAPRP